jgi:hypothetical protein
LGGFMNLNIMGQWNPLCNFNMLSNNDIHWHH